MSRLRQYSASLIERVNTNLSGINLAIVFVFAVLACVALIFVFSRSPDRYVTLLDGRTFSNIEIERLEAAFYDAQLENYRFVDNRLEVSFESRNQYIKLINDGAFLSNGFHEALTTAIQNSSILDSSRTTELKKQLAIGNDTGKLLCRMSEVQNAFVQFVEEPLPGLHRHKKVTASVLVECKSGKRLSDENLRSIRSLVKTIRPGLNVSGITVTEFSDQKMTVHEAGDTLTQKSEFEKKVAAQQRYERRWEQKIREAVDYVPAARITVSAETTTAPPSSKVADPPTFRPSKLGVLINIPTSYYHRIWHAKASEAGMKRNQRPTYDDLRRLRLQIEDKIRSNVKTLTAAHINSEVTVTSFADEIASGATSKSETANLQDWMFIGLVGVAVLVFSALHFQTKRSAKQKNEQSPVVLDSNWDAAQVKPATADTDELRRQISDVIRDDPEAAAQVLGEWMKKAG